MSEDDRAAKAARAKALLKKRQLKKIPDAIPGSALPASPLTRTISPVPSDLVQEDRRDLGELFAKDDGDTSWLTSLPPAQSPPATLPSTTIRDVESRAEVQSMKFESQRQEEINEQERVRSSQLAKRVEQLQGDMEMSLESQRQTINLLVSEKSALLSQLHRFDDLEHKAHATETLLSEEQAKSKSLDDIVQKLRREVDTAMQNLHQSQEKENELAERYREKERQSQLATASTAALREEAKSYQGKLRDLEEQIQSDDRVERLEESLRNTQNRADELEFQLSKLKQAHISLNVQRDDLEARFQTLSASETSWKLKYSDVHSQYVTTIQRLDATLVERNTLDEENTRLKAQVELDRKQLEQSRNDLLHASLTEKQLHAIQAELNAANRRADDAEQVQRNLQAEGMNLMQSLNEMRPKIVELTGEKLDLSEKIENMEQALRSRDFTISQLESTVDELRDDKQQAEEQWKEEIFHKDKEHAEVQKSSSEMQLAFTEMQAELETTLTSLRSLESERTKTHQEASRRMEELDRLIASNQTYSEELSGLRRELSSRQKAQEEEKDFLQRAHNEIESLRIELNNKEEEIQHLRDTVTSSSKETDLPQSLDEEMISSLRQQHTLEMSTAQSKIRTLENSLYDEEARGHVMERKINGLEDQLRSLSRPGLKSFSPIPSRPSSRAQKDSDFHRSSISLHKFTNVAPLSRSVFEQNLSPEALHKRKVSLSMLKARIESEVASSPHISSRALSPVQSQHSQSGENHSHSHSQPSNQVLHRPQFLDESHVFWCHSCRGDLVIL